MCVILQMMFTRGLNHNTTKIGTSLFTNVTQLCALIFSKVTLSFEAVLSFYKCQDYSVFHQCSLRKEFLTPVFFFFTPVAFV